MFTVRSQTSSREPNSPVLGSQDSLNLLVLRRILFAILSMIIANATPSQAQLEAALQPSDSVYYVDSLVPSLLRIEHKPFRAGINGSFGWNRFDSTDPLADNMSEGCDSYLGGRGTSLQGGLHIEYPLWGDVSPFTMLLGLGYRSMSGTLSYDTSYPGFVNDKIEMLHIRTDIDHRSSGIAISPGVAIEPFKHFRFTLQPGNADHYLK